MFPVLVFSLVVSLADIFLWFSGGKVYNWTQWLTINFNLCPCFPQVLVFMSRPVNRSCSRYITSMATLLLNWTSSQVVTVTLWPHVPTTGQSLVEDTTCTYPTTLQVTAVPTPAVATPTPSPLGTLHLVLTVDFMQVDPVTSSLPLMWKCFMRQKLKAFMQNYICWLSQLLRKLNEQLLFEIPSLIHNCPWLVSVSIYRFIQLNKFSLN